LGQCGQPILGLAWRAQSDDGRRAGITLPGSDLFVFAGEAAEVNCLDGFCHAWWRRPHPYLDPAVRAAISGIARLPQDVVEDGMARLRADLTSGAWDRRHRELLAETEIDAGYRLVVSTAA
jgi:hypothetical protein